MIKPYHYEKKDGKYVLIENKTNHIIKTGGKDTIRKLTEHLNKGGGFNGDTPTFFLNRKKI